MNVAEAKLFLEHNVKAKRVPTWLTSTFGAHTLLWQTQEALTEKEHKQILMLLTTEGPEHFVPEHWQILALLSEKERTALSTDIEAAWLTHGAKPTHKWAIFQLAAMQAAQRLIEIAPSLVELASQGNHKRAIWYVETLARLDHPTTKSWLYDIATFGPYQSTLYNEANVWHQHLIAISGLSPEDYLHTIDLHIREKHQEESIDVIDFIPEKTSLSLSEPDDHVITFQPGSHDLALRNKHTRKLFTTFPEESLIHDPTSWRESLETFETLQDKLAPFLKKWQRVFEFAMLSNRPFEHEYIQERFLSNALMSNLLETIIWRTESGHTLRFIEGSCFDSEEDEVPLTPDEKLYLIHPMELTTKEHQQWGESFADNEIMPLFEQLTRETFTPEQHPLDALYFRQRYDLKLNLLETLREQGWRHGEVSYGRFSRSYHLLPGRNLRIWLYHGEIAFQEALYATYDLGIKRVAFEALNGMSLKPSSLEPLLYSETYLMIQRLHATLTRQDS